MSKSAEVEASPVALTEQDASREFGYFATRDGTRIAYVVWRLRAAGKYPTILNYSAYNESALPFEQVRRFLEAGYAYVGANVRGTGASEGVFSNYQPIEAADGAELVEWAAAQSWSTGSIGMVGASYGGHTQIKVAALQPPHLKAIVPISIEGNEYREEGMTGGLFNIGLMAQWDFVIQPELARAGVEARLRGEDHECETIGARQRFVPSCQEALSHPLYDDWWHERALDTMAGHVTVPALLIQAWQDEWMRPNGALRVFNSIRSRHKRIILQNGAHALARYRINQQEQMQWLDRWVKGESNKADKEAPVTVYWEVTEQGGAERAAPSWVTTYSGWPPPNVKWQTLYLTQSGRLSLEPQDVREDHGERSYVYPLGTELIGSNEQFALEPHSLGTLSYRTSPATSDLMVLGSPQLILFVSCEQSDTDFMFTLKDVDSSGNTLFLQRAVLRASLRGVDRELSTPEEIVQSFVRTEKLTPGEIYEVRLSLTALGHALRKGHCLELSVLSPNTVPSPVWGFSCVPQSSINRIYHCARYPSRLLLPVLPGESAHKPAAPLGVLKNQPFRPARTTVG